MTSKHIQGTVHHHGFKAALSKVAAASRKLRRNREKRRRRTWFPGVTAGQVVETAQPDPVKIAVLAMEGLGRASMRAAFTGVTVEVAVPDDATAAIFRAALSETARNRSTDQLVRVVVD